MSHVCVVLCLALAALMPSSVALKCNGMEQLCRLQLQQITLAGSHNSGAGFDGIMKYHTLIGSVLASSCWYRSQSKSITDQLNFGIRYFDIDTCWEGNGRYFKGAWTCHSKAFGGPIKTLLDQVNHWMNQGQNRNEVVVLHFNRDFSKDKKKEIGQDIVRLLEAYWKPTSDRLAAGKLTMQENFHATLGDCVRSNRRIFVIFHSQLLPGYRPRYLHGEWKVGYTWSSQGLVGSGGCEDFVHTLAKNCKRESDKGMPLVRLDLFLTWGLCIHDLASLCNPKTSQAVDECYAETKVRGKTVNLIVVDYVERGGYPNVTEVARRQNLVNIRKYIGL